MTAGLLCHYPHQATGYTIHNYKLTTDFFFLIPHTHTHTHKNGSKKGLHIATITFQALIFGDNNIHTIVLDDYTS